MTLPRDVAVTGANGFVGRGVCERLVASGWTVRGVVRAEAATLSSAVRRVVVPDMADADALTRAFEGANAVVHLAARVHVMRDTDADPGAAYRCDNVDMTRAVLQAATRAGVRRFVFLSSVKVMGEGNTVPWTEDDAPHPVDPYGVSKHEAEALVLRDTDGQRLEPVVLRAPLVYGPGVRANMLQLFDLVDRGVPLPFGGINNRRSLLYVGNLAAAVEAVLESAAAPHQIFFVSDGEDVSTPDLVRAIAAALSRPGRLLAVPESAFRAAGTAGDWVSRFLPSPVNSAALQRLMGSLRVSNAKLRDRVGFQPPYSLEDGLRATARWYRARA